MATCLLRSIAGVLAVACLGAPAADGASYTPAGTLYVGHELLNDCPDVCPAYPTGWREIWRISTSGGSVRGRILSAPQFPAPVLNSPLSPAGDAVLYADQAGIVRVAPVDLQRMLQSPGIPVVGLPPQMGGLAAAWSPDGQRLIFAGELRGRTGIWIAGRDGTAWHRLPCTCTPTAGSLAWSTRDQIAFTAAAPGSDGQRTELWIVNADGTAARRLVVAPKSKRDDAPAWSPDGRQLAFDRTDQYATYGGVMIVDVASGRLRRLAAIGGTPTWSPDGTQLAYLGAADTNTSPSFVAVATAAGQTLGRIPLSDYLEGNGYLDALAWRSTDDAAAEPSPSALSIYLNAPAHSAAARDERDGAELALSDAGAAVDGRPVRLRTFSTQSEHAARTATIDPDVVGYIGEHDAAHTAWSLDRLNPAGIAQVTPASGAALLTDEQHDSEDSTLWETSGVRTLVRLLPGDDIAAAAIAKVASGRHTHRVFLVNADDYEFAPVRRMLRARLAALHIRISGAAGLAKNPGRILRALRANRTDALIYTGVLTPAVARVWNAAHHAVPGLRFYAGHADPLFSTEKEGGCLRRLDRATRARTTLVRPDAPVTAFGAAAIALGERLHAATGRPPTIFTLAGYESLALLLDAIHRAGPTSGRDAIRDALFATHDRRSVLGRYSVRPSGDTTLAREAVYRIAPDGTPIYERSVDAGA